LLKADALGGWRWICAEEIFKANPLKDLLSDLRAYSAAIEAVRAGELPGMSLVERFMERRGDALSRHEVRSALAALKGTDLERAVLADAAAWAAEEAAAIGGWEEATSQDFLRGSPLAGLLDNRRAFDTTVGDLPGSRSTDGRGRPRMRP
jgi:hypothetical protein